MKIVQICPYDMAHHGGVQRHIRDLSAWLRGQGHEVRILSPWPGTGAQGSGAIGSARRVAMNGTGFEMSWISAAERRRVVADLADWGAQIAHFHTPYTPLMPLRIWQALAIPKVVSFHSTPPDSAWNGPKTRIARVLSGWFSWRAEAVVFPSQPVLDLFRALPLRAEPQVIAPAVDLDPWIAARRPSDGEGLRLVYLGRLEPRKGLPTLLAAWPLIESALPQARLVVAGSGSMQAEIMALARSSNQVRHIPAPDDTEARRLVAGSDMLVAPAGYGESFGLVLTEALACGVLPVAAANAGFASVLTGPGRDLLFPVGDAPALAQRVIALAGDPQRHAALRDWGRQHALGFSLDVAGHRHLALFETILKRAGA